MRSFFFSRIPTNQMREEVVRRGALLAAFRVLGFSKGGEGLCLCFDVRWDGEVGGDWRDPRDAGERGIDLHAFADETGIGAWAGGRDEVEGFVEGEVAHCVEGEVVALEGEVDGCA